MNGKKAKMLRKQVKPFVATHAETIYEDVNKRTRLVPYMIPRQIKIGEEHVPVLDEAGVQMLDEAGEPKFTIEPITKNAAHRGGNPMTNQGQGGLPQYAQIQTYTRELAMCARKMYQSLKANYLQTIRV